MSAPKRFEYSVSERSGTPAHAEPDWTAEHLVLAGLARCSLSSLDYYAKRLNVSTSGSAEADGVVTRRESDGRFAFVELRVGLDIEVEPPLAVDRLEDLLSRAEQGCFVGASLTANPTYEWRVNGEDVRQSPASPPGD
ncbi:MAG TPA: OsmC family protein [Gaiellaceae bacterium]